MLNLEKGRLLRRRKCRWKRRKVTQAVIEIVICFYLLELIFSALKEACMCGGLCLRAFGWEQDTSEGRWYILMCYTLCLQAYAWLHLTDRWHYQVHAKSFVTIQQTSAHCCPFSHTQISPCSEAECCEKEPRAAGAGFAVYWLSWVCASVQWWVPPWDCLWLSSEMCSRCGSRKQQVWATVSSSATSKLKYSVE